jgi:hypothetical protein
VGRRNSGVTPPEKDNRLHPCAPLFLLVGRPGSNLRPTDSEAGSTDIKASQINN